VSKIGAAGLGIAVVIAMWLTLSGRSLTDVAVIEELAGVGLMVLAGVLSIAAAFSSVVASTLFEARHHKRKLAKLHTLRSLYERHIELVEKDLARLRPSSHTADSTAPLTPPPMPTAPPTTSALTAAGVAPTALMLLFLIGVPNVLNAQRGRLVVPIRFHQQTVEVQPSIAGLVTHCCRRNQR
jgi:hypothetical protein